MSEHDEQVALFNWAMLQAGKYPELDLLFAIPNGSYKSITQAMKFKREGLKPGVPDVCLPVARNGYHGLYIEMKYGKNKLSDKQIWWRNELKKQGYLVWLSYRFEDAKDIILAYLNGKVVEAHL